jgi:hypothetical protein
MPRIICNNTVKTARPNAARIVIENPSLVRQVYTGKPGCCCGCNGNYSRGAAAIKAHVTRSNTLLANNVDSEWKIDVVNGSHVALDSSTRYRTIYIDQNAAIITRCGNLIVISARKTA